MNKQEFLNQMEEIFEKCEKAKLDFSNIVYNIKCSIPTIEGFEAIKEGLAKVGITEEEFETFKITGIWQGYSICLRFTEDSPLFNIAVKQSDGFKMQMDVIDSYCYPHGDYKAGYYGVLGINGYRYIDLEGDRAESENENYVPIKLITYQAQLSDAHEIYPWIKTMYQGGTDYYNSLESWDSVCKKKEKSVLNK